MNAKQTKTPALRLALTALAPAMTSWTPAAQALTASVMTSGHLRAAPRAAYPFVAMMFAGSTARVFGWVIVANSAVLLAIPTATFVLNGCGHSYYRRRPGTSR